MIRLISTVCAMALLSGCGAGSIQELQDHPVAKYEFDAPMSYAAAYSLIAYPTIRCFQSAGPAASWYVDSDLLTDKRQGQVNISLTNLGKRYYGSVLVVPKDELTSHVTVWTNLASIQHLGPDAERWSKGQASCK
ncbi:MAG TPA: hypothetical protein VM639_12835 [Dongiaceae bacterium]|nr:hypothetical protein [Dongiaceae bacterium]